MALTCAVACAMLGGGRSTLKPFCVRENCIVSSLGIVATPCQGDGNESICHESGAFYRTRQCDHLDAEVIDTIENRTDQVYPYMHYLFGTLFVYSIFQRQSVSSHSLVKLLPTSSLARTRRRVNPRAHYLLGALVLLLCIGFGEGSIVDDLQSRAAKTRWDVLPNTRGKQLTKDITRLINGLFSFNKSFTTAWSGNLPNKTPDQVSEAICNIWTAVFIQLLSPQFASSLFDRLEELYIHPINKTTCSHALEADTKLILALIGNACGLLNLRRLALSGRRSHALAAHLLLAFNPSESAAILSKLGDVDGVRMQVITCILVRQLE